MIIIIIIIILSPRSTSAAVDVRGAATRWLYLCIKVQHTRARTRYFSVCHRLYTYRVFFHLSRPPTALSSRFSSVNPVPVTRDPIFRFLPAPPAPTSPPPYSRRRRRRRPSDAWAAKCSILVPGRLLYTIWRQTNWLRAPHIWLDVTVVT